MNSLDLLVNSSGRNTYEVESKNKNSGFIPYNSEQDMSNMTNQERISQSPPIILCETSDSRNPRSHTHRYLFYPSISRLSIIS